LVPVVLGDSFRELFGLAGTGTQFKDRILLQSPGPESAGNVHGAVKDFDSFV
jgi:hypothetical protein